MSSTRHFDRDGRPLSLLEWATLYEDMTYRRVAETTLPDGKWVSTVWLGLDHRFSEDGPPLTFETMVFQARDNLDEVDMERYSTKEEAQQGHTAMVEKWSKIEVTP